MTVTWHCQHEGSEQRGKSQSHHVNHVCHNPSVFGAGETGSERKDALEQVHTQSLGSEATSVKSSCEDQREGTRVMSLNAGRGRQEGSLR